jgi:pimeloyl-ACP methyl ester carboxylesterase
MNASAPKSAYAAVNDLQLYYEIHGSGRLLVLLHGGVAASEAFGPNLPALAASRQVIAAHLQGHGNTRDIDRPLRFESMADDVAALVHQLGLKKVGPVGGGAWHDALQHPRHRCGRLDGGPVSGGLVADLRC